MNHQFQYLKGTFRCKKCKIATTRPEMYTKDNCQGRAIPKRKRFNYLPNDKQTEDLDRLYEGGDRENIQTSA